MKFPKAEGRGGGRMTVPESDGRINSLFVYEVLAKDSRCT